MKKVLMVASVTMHIKAFHLPYLELFKNNGYMVEVASNGEEKIPFCDVHHQIDFQRSPLKKDNINSYFKLKRVIENGDYDIIHCHTPVAAMLTRLAARKVKKEGTRVIYTAHGFHFFKGAPLKNWLIYFPVEWLCSFFTDTLITINTEDFEFAKKHLHAKQTEYVHGVGIDTEKFKNIEVDRDKKREELGIPKESFAVLSVGELNDNKNHETVLRAIAKLERKDIVYVICGQGDKKEYLENLAKELGMEDRLILAGYRKDIAEIYKCCDLFAFPSKREGLGMAALEAMTSGLSVVGSNVHGIPDYLIDGKTGFGCSPWDVDAFAEKIQMLINDQELRNTIGEKNKKFVEKFDLGNSIKEIKKIYDT